MVNFAYKSRRAHSFFVSLMASYGMEWKLFVFCFSFQVTELESEFEKLPPGKPSQTRFLRSQQDLKAKMLERAAAGAEEASADGSYYFSALLNYDVV